MGTEIGARNFGDSDRYDLVPTVAERMGLDTSNEATTATWSIHRFCRTQPGRSAGSGCAPTNPILRQGDMHTFRLDDGSD